jgi:hypothetical protein
VNRATSCRRTACRYRVSSTGGIMATALDLDLVVSFPEKVAAKLTDAVQVA